MYLVLSVFYLARLGNLPALFGSGVDSNYPALYQYPKDLSESG